MTAYLDKANLGYPQFSMDNRQLRAWIDKHKAEFRQRLKAFVEINTFTANHAGVDEGMALLDQLAAAYGLQSEPVNSRHRLLSRSSGSGKRILLISHMDTVFPPDGEFLHFEQLPDGFVRGPGVGDIKGGMLMGLWALRAIHLLANEFDLQMIVSADEEIGSQSIRDWYLGGHTGADYAIGLEPGFPQGDLSADVPLGVVYQRRGYGAFSFTIHGKAAHSGTASLGLNAIEATAHRITRIHELSQPQLGMSTNIGTIHGGISPNTVPGKVTGTVSFRFERKRDGELLRDQIKLILTESLLHNEAQDLYDKGTCTLEAFMPPMEHTAANQKMIDIVLEEAERLGHRVIPIVRGGGSDANWISASGIPAICGLGAPTHGLHTTEEMIYLPMVYERIALLTYTIYRLLQSDR